MLRIFNMYFNYFYAVFNRLKSIVYYKEEDIILKNNIQENKKYISKSNKKYIKLYCNRHTRFKFYKHLKSKNSPFIVYSLGNEDKQTNKILIIKNK